MNHTKLEKRKQNEKMQVLEKMVLLILKKEYPALNIYEMEEDLDEIDRKDIYRELKEMISL